jgi:hypothetical protein
LDGIVSVDKDTLKSSVSEEVRRMNPGLFGDPGPVKERSRELGTHIDVPKKKSTKRADGYKSQLEADYAARLKTLELAGIVKRWRYEPVNIRLVDKKKAQSHYNPDWLVEYNDGRWFFDETKGYMRSTGRLKLYLAATDFPMFKFRKVTREDGEWKIVEI